MGGSGRRALLATVLVGALVAARSGPAASAEVRVEVLGQAALAPPTVGFELRDPRTGKPLAPARDGLEELLGGVRPAAVLDTGASSYVLSGPTAEHYGVVPEPGGRYVEVGMAGEHGMAVSRAYTLALLGDDAGGRRARPLVLTAQRFLLNDAPADLTTLLTAPGSSIDVVGMPAIRETTVVIEPASGLPGAVALALGADGARAEAELWIALSLVDLNRRRHPGNRGPLPSLAASPLVSGVRAVGGRSAVRGDWLLDTGSVVTLLSMAHARTLGLIDGRGRPARPPEFTLPIGGISGAQQSLPGFRLDRLEIPGERGITLVLEHAPVLVHDIATTRDDGTTVVLDGVLGMNLFLASGTDPALVGFAAQHDAPFTRLVIDGRRGRLGLTPRR